MDKHTLNAATIGILLRDVIESDLPIFFEQQLDPDANYMAAFTPKEPTNREAFTAHWNRILAEATVIIKTIVFDGQVAGSVLSYEDSGKPEVSYWIGKEYWGQSIATHALSDFLVHGNKTRPIYARAAKDNIASLRVLEKKWVRDNWRGQGVCQRTRRGGRGICSGTCITAIGITSRKSTCHSPVPKSPILPL